MVEDRRPKQDRNASQGPNQNSYSLAKLWNLSVPIRGLLKGPADPQCHPFVKSAAHDLQRSRQAI